MSPQKPWQKVRFVALAGVGGAVLTGLALAPAVALTPAAVSTQGASGAVGGRVSVGPRPDVDGDGLVDLVIGAAKAVAIVTGDGTRRFATAPEADAVNTVFGTSIATGDFNGDGYDDLAAADSWYADVAGAVWIYAGGPRGTLVGDGSTATVKLQQGLDGLPGTPGREELFGAALAAGDLTGDGIDDLAIGTPFETVNAAERAGSVTLVPGSSTGLAPARSRLFTQATPGIPGAAEPGDLFGAALATGDVTGEGRPDLAVGSPGENADGMVQLLPGAAGGPTGRATTSVTAGQLAIRAGAGSVAEFGSRLAIGDLTGDGRGELVAGAPAARVGRVVCGAVGILRGAATGISSTRAQLVSQSSPKVSGICETNDEWGGALAVGDLTGDRRPELVVGAPVESVGALNGGGSYTVLHRSSRGVAGTGSFGITQNTANVADTAELGDEFAGHLDLVDLNRDGRLDVVATAEGERAGSRRTGYAAILVSTAAGTPAGRSSVLTGDSFTPPIERLGRSLP